MVHKARCTNCKEVVVQTARYKLGEALRGNCPYCRQRGTLREVSKTIPKKEVLTNGCQGKWKGRKSKRKLPRGIGRVGECVTPLTPTQKRMMHIRMAV